MHASTKTLALFLAVTTGALTLASATASLVGCGPDAKPQPTAPTASAAPSAAPAAAMASPLPQEEPKKAEVSVVRISDEILQACGIAAPNALFAFDSAVVRDTEAGTLQAIVTCFTSGPLKGRTIRLVGHADPRGTSDYNMTLGQSRADSVGNYLKSKGMEKSKVEATTRGAMDAVGSDEPTWAKDRKVDILLAK